MSATTTLGPFELDTPVGKGGMGAVYRAHHVETEEPVAIKVLLASNTRERDDRERFRREVQALAKLHHPGIAAILDYGAIDAETARVGPEIFAEGAPWFAMEFVDGEPMQKGASDWSWARLESFLFQVLDALAYAHARSIVHRDLKPDNILMPADDEERTVRLVDFGIARLFDATDRRHSEASNRVTGTPKYMAPEQIHGAWRDQGPWTDLYALGCLTWRLVCGGAPFEAGSTTEVLKRQLSESPPEFNPAFAVPSGLENWLRGLLHKSVDRRTRRAADAAWSLLQLGEPERTEHGASSERRRTTATSPAVQTLGTLTETISEEGPPSFLEETETDVSAPGSNAPDPGPREAAPTLRQEPVTDDAPAGSGDGVPPVLPDWRRDRPLTRAAAVPRAGLELFGLREVPVVDRETERDRLWHALHDVRQANRPGAALIEAEAGAGKTRLAEWFCRRVHETGGGRILRATHDPSSGPEDGLRSMVRREFQTYGLDRDEVFDRLVDRLPSTGPNDEMRIVDARGLTEFIRPTDDAAEHVDGPRYHFSSARQKYGLVVRLFERLGRRRPVVAWFDDLQWGRASLDVVEYLLTGSDSSPPVLAIGTVRTDTVADDPDLAERIERFRDRASPRRIELGTLSPDAHRELIDSLLDLAPGLAERLATVTEGNPLFAIQLLREWVERDLLEPAADGFRLRDERELDVPDGVHQLWLRRLERLVASLPESEETVWRALELSAALGRDIDRSEWRAVLDRADLEVSADLVDRLVDRGLARRTEAGWSFAHRLLVDSLERRSRDAGRWRAHHRVCARSLADRFTGEDVGEFHRVFEHWIAADEPERAFAPLIDGVAAASRQGLDDERERLLEMGRDILDAAGAESDDPRRLRWLIESATHHIDRGDVDRAAELLTTCWERLGDEGDRLRAKAAYQMASVERDRGELESVRYWAETGLDAARRADDTWLTGRCHRRLGWYHFAVNDLDRAADHLEAAREHALEAGDTYSATEALRQLGGIARRRGRHDPIQILEDVRDEAAEAGFTELEALATNDLGEVARFDGRLDDAREYYREYTRFMRELSRPANLAIGRLNLAQIDVCTGAFDRAAERLETARGEFDSLGGSNRLRGLTATIRLTGAAGTEDRERFDELWERFAGGWPEDWRLVDDVPWLLEATAAYADRSGWTERARRVREFARDCWLELDEPEAAERVADDLDR